VGLEQGTCKGFNKGINRCLQKVSRFASGHVLEHGAAIQAARRTCGLPWERLTKFKGWGLFRRAVPIATTAAIEIGSFRYFVASGLKMLRVVIPMAGTFFVGHLAHEGWHRAEVEWKQKRGSLSTWLFAAVAMCDTFDTAVHALVVASHTVVHVNHHLIHRLEHLALMAALLAMICMMLGELISAGALQARLHQWCCRKASGNTCFKKKSVRIVPCVP